MYYFPLQRDRQCNNSARVHWVHVNPFDVAATGACWLTNFPAPFDTEPNHSSSLSPESLLFLKVDYTDLHWHGCYPPFWFTPPHCFWTCRVCILYSFKWKINSLLHPCLYNIRFTSTLPSGLWPLGSVLVNWILHEQGCNNTYIQFPLHNYLSAM